MCVGISRKVFYFLDGRKGKENVEKEVFLMKQDSGIIDIIVDENFIDEETFN